MRRKRVFFCFVSIIVVFVANNLNDFLSYISAAETQGTVNKKIDFIKDIQPILKVCYGCHGPDTQQGQLRLDNKALALRGGISGKVILPGNSQYSRLVHRVLGLGDEERMPLKGDPLSQEQIALIRAWIDQGAPWLEEAASGNAKIEKHWAYVKPVRPEPSSVKNTSWIRNPIDNFILARLEKERLSPSAEASREALIRRVSLDLTGLSPSVKEVDNFLADQSPNAYEKLVDRLLASPHYGERWARPWLDLAHYADTNGYETDERRSIWKYRDWVINALNQDMPFDRFTIEQIAGDMLPNATHDQKIATGFHRNTPFNEEDGVDQEEALWETIVDRVGTTGTVWLGSTVACAQCHNHKYDPFTQKDFYRFFAFFNNTDYHFETNPKIGSIIPKIVESKLEIPPPGRQTEFNDLATEITKLEAQLNAPSPELDGAHAEWEREVTAPQSQWTLLDPMEFWSSSGATITHSDDQSQAGSERDGEGAHGRFAGKWETKPEYNWKNAGLEPNDDLPVMNVVWNDAVAFCRWLSNKEGKHYRLPTEVEWEFACRAGTNTPYYWGSDESLQAQYVWSGSNSGEMPHPVGQCKPNPFGLYDMNGHVYEYCSDYYSLTAYAAALLVDPMGPATGAEIVVRSASWGTDPIHCRSVFRGSAGMTHRNRRDGFRLVQAAN